ncbi:MAG TPA: YceI family protein, partial [Opitutus sp.]|nr:YceI family protein [Opitutus sp.]
GAITFEIAGLSNVKQNGTGYTGDARGKLTLKGVTKDVTVPVKLTYLAGAYGQRVNKPELKGDLLVVRGDFTILRSDFDINSGNMEDKVSNEIALSLALAGGAPQS